MQDEAVDSQVDQIADAVGDLLDKHNEEQSKAKKQAAAAAEFVNADDEKSECILPVDSDHERQSLNIPTPQKRSEIDEEEIDPPGHSYSRKLGDADQNNLSDTDAKRVTRSAKGFQATGVKTGASSKKK